MLWEVVQEVSPQEGPHGRAGRDLTTGRGQGSEKKPCGPAPGGGRREARSQPAIPKNVTGRVVSGSLQHAIKSPESLV